MAIEFHKEVAGGVVSVKASGKLSKKDYEKFVPEMEKFIEQHGKIRILFEMHDFHGWDMGAMWEDLKFDLKHFSSIERLAIIGESKWQEWMSKFCAPFTTAKIRYFTYDQTDDASQWVRED